jgi:hypothetical protein
LTRHGRLRWSISLGLLAVSLWIALTGTRPTGVNDFAEYWAASRRLLLRQNPYASRPQMARELGLVSREPLPPVMLMRNPPWALPLVLPLGLLSYRAAQLLWSFIGFAAALVSIGLLWRAYSVPKHPHWQGWLSAGLFLPLATAIALGQIGPLVLLGLTGFLIFQEKKQDVWAGAFGLLIALKPHLVFLFWPALLLWIVRERRWRVLWGLGLALSGATVLALRFDTQILRHYHDLWTETRVVWEEIPTLGGVLSLLIDHRQHWLAYMPAIGAAIWFAVRWLRNGRDWRWFEQMPLLLLVSVASTPYAWFFDQVVLLPAVLQAAARVSAGPLRKGLGPSLAYIGINALTLGLILSHRTLFWYAWTASIWLILYLATMRHDVTLRNREHQGEAPSSQTSSIRARPISQPS